MILARGANLCGEKIAKFLCGEHGETAGATISKLYTGNSGISSFRIQDDHAMQKAVSGNAEFD